MKAYLSVSLHHTSETASHGGQFVKRKSFEHAVLLLSSDLKTFGRILKRLSRPI
jgi:hypothetical protein